MINCFDSPFGQFLSKRNFILAKLMFELLKHDKICPHIGEWDAKMQGDTFFYCHSEDITHTIELCD